MKLVLASSNRGKLQEFREMFGDARFDIHTQSEFGVADAEETGLTFVENALLKARNATQATGLPALGDDSGIVVDALGGAPGLYSARYAGGHGGTSDDSAQRNIDKLLRELDGVADAQRSAHFYCVLVVLRHAGDPQPLIAEGSWHGRILQAPRGAGGFGYDPVFLDPDSGLSAAEIAPEAKNRISHRGRAMAALRQQIESVLPRIHADQSG